jgi:hypothetical protein
MKNEDYVLCGGKEKEGKGVQLLHGGWSCWVWT